MTAKTINITKLHNEVVKKHLAEYGSWSYEQTKQAVTRVKIGDGWYSLDFKSVCRKALDLIEVSEIQSLKFELLIARMKESNMAPFYQFAMGEAIEKALIS